MRVAFFTEAYDPFMNGVIVLVKSYREQLLRMGHEVVVFAPEFPGYRDTDDGIVRLPSIVLCRQAYPCLRPFSGIDADVRRRRFDLIHSHHAFSTGLAAERLAHACGIPLVHSFHTLLPMLSGYVPLPRSLTQAALTYIIRRHCSRAARVVVTNGLMRNWLRDHGVRTPISVVPPVVESKAPAPGSRERIRAQFRIPPDVPLLLFVGRLGPEKNLGFLLRSLTRLPRDRNWRLMLVGSGVEETRLPRLAADLDLSERTIFTGEAPHDRVPDYYAAGDVFVFPSPSDTFGLVLLEAMAAGLPSVAVGVNGPRAVLEDNVTGLLTPLEESAFAVAIDRLLTDNALRQQMGRAAAERATLYSEDNAAASLLDAYSLALRCAPLTHNPKLKTTSAP